MPLAIPFIPVEEPFIDAETYGAMSVEMARKNAASSEWKGAWAPGNYTTGNVVRDGSYTCVALADTSERPAPVPDGNPSWTLPDAPAWVDQTATGVSYSGVEVDLGANAVEITSWSAWIPDASLDINYALYLHEISDPANEVLLGSETLNTTQTGWVTSNIPPRIFLPGQKFRFTIVSSKATGGSTWGPFVWQYEGTGCAPDDGKYERNSAHTQICVPEIDKDDINRGSSLALLKQGDFLTLTESQNSSRWDRYEIVSSTPVGSVYVLEVLRRENGSTVRSGKEVNFEAEIRSGIQPSPYVQLPDYFVDNPPAQDTVVRGFATDDFPPAAFNQDAHGIDLRTVTLVQSSDWDIWSISRL